MGGGLNTFGYVGGNPINFYDSLGLFQVGRLPEYRNVDFSTEVQLRRRESVLEELGRQFQEYINSDRVCDGYRDTMQSYFDDWVVYASLEERSHGRAYTEPVNPFTTFYNNWYQDRFNNNRQTQFGQRYRDFAHEFRHLMDENRQYVNPYRSESDANLFEEDFWNAHRGRGCLCR